MVFCAILSYFYENYWNMFRNIFVFGFDIKVKIRKGKKNLRGKFEDRLICFELIELNLENKNDY